MHLNGVRLFSFVLCFFFVMIRRPPRSTQSRSSAASDVYKRQVLSNLSRLINDCETYFTGKRADNKSQIGKRWQMVMWRYDKDDEYDNLLNYKAVSYTHLRAHETPEHLVCRLLLEKKKNKK